MGLFAVGYPDVFDLRGVAEEPAALRLRWIEPVDGAAVVAEDLLQVSDGCGRGGFIAEAPDRVDVIVLGEHLAQLAGLAGDEVHHPAGEIVGVEDLVQLAHQRSRALAGDGDDRVAHRDCREDQREARRFTVRGIQIEELAVSLPPADLLPHADITWTHHAEGNQRQRAKQFMKELASEMREIVQKEGYQHLVLGCREEFWGDLLPCLAHEGLSPFIAGHCRLPNIDMAAKEVLGEANDVMTTYRDSLVSSFWKTVSEGPDRSAIGVNAVLGAFQAGRVQKLFLGSISGITVGECADCGGCFLGAERKCPSCGSSIIYKMVAEELLLRKALLADMEILTTNELAPDQTKIAAAILRY